MDFDASSVSIQKKLESLNITENNDTYIESTTIYHRLKNELYGTDSENMDSDSPARQIVTRSS